MVWYVCILYAPRHQVIGQSTELFCLAGFISGYILQYIHTNTDTCVRCWYCMIYAHDFICLCCDTFMHTHTHMPITLRSSFSFFAAIQTEQSQSGQSQSRPLPCGSRCSAHLGALAFLLALDKPTRDVTARCSASSATLAQAHLGCISCSSERFFRRFYS